MFYINNHNENGTGFQMTFINGLTASVQFGKGNYCRNKRIEYYVDAFGRYKCPNAEIAVFDDRGNFRDLNEFLPDSCFCMDSVAGYISADTVADFIKAVKDWRE